MNIFQFSNCISIFKSLSLENVYIVLKFLKRMQMHNILKLKLKLAAQNENESESWS